MPKIIDYETEMVSANIFKYDDIDMDINVVCVKYGTKYGADYVNKLYHGVRKNLSLKHTFSCFTENAEGLDPNVKVLPLQNHWKAWWSKVNIFDGAAYPNP